MQIQSRQFTAYITGRCRQQTFKTLCASAAATHYRSKAPKDINVLVVGPTGYIGKFVTQELISRGFNVTAFAREKAGIKGKMSKEDTIKVSGTCVVKF